MESALLRYGTTALVTGASSGIGAAFCRRLAIEGFTTVVAVARRSERLEDLQQEIEATSSTRIVPIVVDLEKYGSADDLASQISHKGLTIDLVVNNAGFGLLGALESLDKSRLTGMVDLNCRAVVDITAQFLPGMKQRKRGAMIITSSVVGAIPAPWFAVYSATKAFDLYLGEALHAECKGSGVLRGPSFTPGRALGITTRRIEVLSRSCRPRSQRLDESQSLSMVSSISS